MLFACSAAWTATPEIALGDGTQNETGQQLFTTQERGFLARKQTVRMCVDPDWMPMERIHNGRHEGIAADYIKLIEQKLGIPIDLVVTRNWPESVAFAKARRCDIFSLAMSTPERLQYMSFTQPYLRLPLVLATRKEHSYVADVTLITDEPLGIVSGYAFAEILRAKHPEMNIRDIPSLRDGLDMVEKGELYGVIGTLASIGYLVQLGYPELKIAGKFDQFWELGIGVRNDEPLLFSAFDKAVAATDRQQTQAILNRWISVKYEKGVDYSFLWKLLPFALLILAFGIYRQQLLKKHNRELQRLAETDALTHTASRRKIDHLLLHYVESYRRYERVFSIIMIDLDYFKRVNDRFGHLHGDQALVELCLRLNTRLRKLDTLGRWGGEEFLAILPDTDYEHALELAEELRQIINNTGFAHIGRQTASFGVAEYNDMKLTPEALVSQADTALYAAKSGGRNAVLGWNALPPEAREQRQLSAGLR